MKAKEVSSTPLEAEAVMLGVGREKYSVNNDLEQLPGQLPTAGSGGKIGPKEPVFEGARG